MPDRDLPDLWVAGMRRATSVHQLSWQQLLYYRISCSFARIPAGDQTSRAENALHLPESAYFFIDHCHPEFSDHAIAYSVQGSEVRVSPFDTGGLYSGRLRTEPPQDTENKKRQFLRRYTLPPDKYMSEFSTWTRLTFVEFRDYVSGSRPSLPYALEVEMVESRDWLWEGRAPKNGSTTYVPKRLFLESTKYTEYVTWLVRTPEIPAKQRENHFATLDKIRDHGNGDRAGVAMNDWLLKGAME